MSPSDLNRAVARLTGETVREIKHRGFQPLVLGPSPSDPEDAIIDWDQLELARNVPVIEQRRAHLIA